MWYEEKISIIINRRRKITKKVQIKSRRGKDNLPPNHLKKNAVNEHFCKLWIYLKFYISLSSIQSSVLYVVLLGLGTKHIMFWLQIPGFVSTNTAGKLSQHLV